MNRISPTSMPINEFLRYRRDVLGEYSEVLVLDEYDDFLDRDDQKTKVISFKRNRLGFLIHLFKMRDAILHLHQTRSGFLVTFLTLLMFKRIVKSITIHNNFEKFSFVNKLLLLFNISFASRVSFVSQSSFDSFPKVFLRLFSKKCEVITNGVDLERVNQFIRNQKFTNSHNKEDKVRLVYIGKFYLQKNHDLVLEVLKSLPGKYVLTLVGDGPERIRIEEKAKSLGIYERITFTGLIRREEVYEVLCKSDIFCSTALWEGMPIGVLESMACSLPVVLSDIPPHQEINSCSDIPLVFKSQKEFVDRILFLGSLDVKNMGVIGDYSYRLVRENYSLALMHERYTAFYHESLR